MRESVVSGRVASEANPWSLTTITVHPSALEEASEHPVGVLVVAIDDRAERRESGGVDGGSWGGRYDMNRWPTVSVPSK